MSPRGLRLLGFGVLAALVAFGVIAAVMYWFDPPQAIEEAILDRVVDDVKVIDIDADPALRQAVKDSLTGRTPQPVEVENPKAKPKGYTVPPHEVKGFVQVEVKLDAAGKVIDAKVVGAIPPGVYDRQALAEVRARHYTPLIVDGQAVPGKVTEVVPFTVEAPPTKAH